MKTSMDLKKLYLRFPLLRSYLGRKTMSRVLVCGGRDFDDYNLLKSYLDTHEISTIIHGNAKGADSLADKYARENAIDRIVYPANWEGHGKLAGFIRNSMMLNHGKPDKVIAFPGGR